MGPLFSGRGTKSISGMEILPLGRKSLHHSLNLMPSSPQSLKAGRSCLHCLPRAGCFLPFRQGALETASSEAHVDLAQRIWQKDTNQAASKQPKEECTSSVPNLCTRAVVFLWDVMSLPYDTVWYPPCFISCLHIIHGCFV